MKLPLPVPDNPPSLLAWVIDNPDAVRDAFTVINLLASLQIEVVTPDAARELGGNKPTLKISDQRIIAPIPLKFPSPWSIPTGSPSRGTFNANESTTASATYSQAQVQAINDRLTATRAILAALILDLQSTGQAPTA